MFWLFRLLAFVWQHRYRLLLPTVLLPVFVLAWHLSRPTLYTATTTLQLDLGATNSAVLAHLTQPGNDKLLQEVLTSPNVLEDTAAETGNKPNPAHLHLRLLNNRLIQITYDSPYRDGLEETLDTLALNFIHEILAPERFRTQQQLQDLEDKIRKYRADLAETEKSLAGLKKEVNNRNPASIQRYQQRLSTLNFQQERLNTQLRLAQKDYEDLLVSLRTLAPEPASAVAVNALWFAEPTMVVDPNSDATLYVARLLDAAYVGFFLGLLLVLFHRLADTSLRQDDEITKATGARVLGHLPALGRLKIGPNVMTTEPKGGPGA